VSQSVMVSARQLPVWAIIDTSPHATADKSLFTVTTSLG